MTLSSRWTTCSRLSGALRWRVFSLLASHAYCISSICSKALFIVSRERHGDWFTGSSVSLTLWTFSLAASMRSFGFWSCPPAWTTCTSTSVSSICSKAVFIVSRDTEAGSPAVPSRWRSGHFLSRRRCVPSLSDLVHLHRLPVHQQALQPESFLDTARWCCRLRVIAVSLRNQFDRQWGRNIVGP